jgi:16S rRNA U1498 N3-methylase RsmE
MAVGKKNSGKFQQDAVVGRFAADARKPQELNAIVKAAMAQAERNRIYRAEQEAKAKLNPPRFVK